MTTPKKTRFACLFESVVERANVVSAATKVTDTLQDMAQELAKIQADDVMPLLDTLRSEFGQKVAERFSAITNEKVQGLIKAVEDAKEGIGGEIDRLEKVINGGSDLGADGIEDALPGDDEMADDGLADDALGDDALGDVPDLPGAAPARDTAAPGAASADEFNLGGTIGSADNSAGRARKESRARRGRKLVEYKSPSFDGNLRTLEFFHGKAGMLARQIETMIDGGRLDGGERMALANVLSHLASVASDPSHWQDAEDKVESALRAANVTDRGNPEVAAVVNRLKKLGHLIAFQHEDMPAPPLATHQPIAERRRPANGRNIRRLREASDPDAVLLGVVRHQVRAGRPVKEAVRRTARAFAVDVADVARILREAIAVARHRARLAEFDMHTPASAKGMFKGDDIADLNSRRGRDKKAIANKTKAGRGHAAQSKDLKRVNFAIRAKRHWGKVKEAAPLPPGQPAATPATGTANRQVPTPGQHSPLGLPTQGTATPGSATPTTPSTNLPPLRQPPVAGQPAAGQPAASQPQGTPQPPQPPQAPVQAGSRPPAQAPVQGNPGVAPRAGSNGVPGNSGEASAMDATDPNAARVPGQPAPAPRPGLRR